MNREQAKGIVANFDLIKHFAEGGEVGHRLIDCHGKQLYISPAKGIGLGGISPYGNCLYVKVKARYRWDPYLNAYVHAPRHWPERIRESEILNEAKS